MSKKPLALTGTAALLTAAVFVSRDQGLFGPPGGPLLEFPGFANQSTTGIETCTSVGDSGQAQMMVTSMQFSREHQLPSGFTFTGVEVKASQYVTEYESVLVHGSETVPWYVRVLPEGEIPPGYWAEPLPATYQNDMNAGVGILLTVDLEGVENSEEPVVELTGLSYSSPDGSSFTVPMDRKVWLSTLEVEEDGFCSAFPSFGD